MLMFVIGQEIKVPQLVHLDEITTMHSEWAALWPDYNFFYARLDQDVFVENLAEAGPFMLDRG